MPEVAHGCALAAPVPSPGQVWPHEALRDPRGSAGSSGLRFPARMWSLLPGIFAAEIEDHVRPWWRRVSDLAADPLLWEAGGRESGRQ